MKLNCLSSDPIQLWGEDKCIRSDKSFFLFFVFHLSWIFSFFYILYVNLILMACLLKVLRFSHEHKAITKSNFPKVDYLKWKSLFSFKWFFSIISIIRRGFLFLFLHEIKIFKWKIWFTWLNFFSTGFKSFSLLFFSWKLYNFL